MTVATPGLDLGEDLQSISKKKDPEKNENPTQHVDLNRGVIQGYHPKGFFVCMYIDDPGIYFMTNMKPVSEEIAREAFFDVEENRRARLKKELTAEAIAKVNRQIQRIEEEAENEVERKVEEKIKAEVPGTPRIPTGPVVIPPRKEAPDPRKIAAEKLGARAVTNRFGQLIETDELNMAHIGRGWYNVIEKKTNEIIEGGEKVDGNQAAALILKWHDVE